ncbi:ZIP Zinc transporter family protein [Trichuris trichiura]|uniref:ZIP Zinc transporter family protein n=1 Tax=Trichuris trichiura TaxID=36087 RepID=A0A077Z2T5_TRITR|nr:ZIP Zinc transporter family protein [Trichuris trichiura]
MDPLVLKVILTILLFFFCFGFGLLPVKVGLLKILRQRAAAQHTSSRSWPSLVLCFLSCFAGGIFLATCFLHLLPEVRHNCDELMEIYGVDSDYPFAELISCIGFFLVFLLEEAVLYFVGTHQAHKKGKPCSRLVQILLLALSNFIRVFSVSCCSRCTGIELPITAEPECCGLPTGDNSTDPPIVMGFKPHAHSHEVRSVTLIVALSFHSIIEGIAFGIQSTNEAATALFLSIAIHKCVVAFGLGVQLARTHSQQMRMVFLSIVTFSMMTPIGAVIGIGVVQGQMHSTTKDLVVMLFEGLSVGTFLYVTFFEVLLHERDNEHPNFVKLLATLCGFAIISFMRIVGHGHSHSHVDEGRDVGEALVNQNASSFG